MREIHHALCQGVSMILPALLPETMHNFAQKRPLQKRVRGVRDAAMGNNTATPTVILPKFMQSTALLTSTSSSPRKGAQFGKGRRGRALRLQTTRRDRERVRQSLCLITYIAQTPLGNECDRHSATAVTTSRVGLTIVLAIKSLSILPSRQPVFVLAMVTP